MGFWKLYKQEFRKEMEKYGMIQPKPTNTGDGGQNISDPDVTKWQPIYEKFRLREGRDPYSFRELKDWWTRY